ncbi:MAG: DeoR/GlpR family DNA-binding transcription regulator [Sphaerochaetaceae bacterium]|jgi:DeoR/GlpR family transcriptional regulator of sugar metabolism|nr:DeoR/GlpR family DNA-binding transcription regulator [Sphaerochaetaceae bacterium]
MQSSAKRKQYIQSKLDADQSVQVGKLAQELGVSEMTIRRDLNDLERIGVLRKTHGGAVKDVSRSYEPPFSLRMHESLEEKRMIGREAVRYVNEGDTIAIDSGTTTIELAKELVSFKNLTIVTTSIHIAMIFLDHPSITVLLSGGVLRKHEGSLVGSFARSTFNSLYFDTFFVSAAALSEEAGLSDYIIEDATVKRMIMEHAKRTVALVHAEKFGQAAFAQIAPLDEIDVLITDKQPYPALQHELQRQKVTTIIAHAKEN